MEASVEPVHPGRVQTSLPLTERTSSSPTQSTVANARSGSALVAQPVPVNTGLPVATTAQEDTASRTTSLELERFYDASDIPLVDSTDTEANPKNTSAEYYMACKYYILILLRLLFPSSVSAQIKTWGRKAFLVGQSKFSQAMLCWNTCHAPIFSMTILVPHSSANCERISAAWAGLNFYADTFKLYILNIVESCLPVGLQSQAVLGRITGLMVMPSDTVFFLIASRWPMLGVTLNNWQCLLTMLFDFGQCSLTAVAAAAIACVRTVWLNMSSAGVRYYEIFTFDFKDSGNLICDFIGEVDTAFPFKVASKMSSLAEIVAAFTDSSLYAIEMLWPDFCAVAPAFVFLLAHMLWGFWHCEAWFWQTIVDTVPDTCVVLATSVLVSLESTMCWLLETVLLTTMGHVWFATCLAAQFVATFICTLAVGNGVQVRSRPLTQCCLS